MESCVKLKTELPRKPLKSYANSCANISGDHSAMTLRELESQMYLAQSKLATQSPLCVYRISYLLTLHCKHVIIQTLPW